MIFQRFYNRGFLFVLLATVFFSFKGIFIKMAYAQGVRPAELMFIRMMIALPCYVLVLLLPVNRQGLSALNFNSTCRLIFYGFCGYYLASYFDLTGLLYVPASIERLVLYSYPGIVLILSVIFLGAPVNRHMLVSLLLIYAGLLSIFVDDAFSAQMHSSSQLRGVVLIFAAAVSFSVYLIGSEIMMKKLSSHVFTCVAMIAACVMTAMHYVGFYSLSGLLMLNAWVYLYAALIAILCTVLPSFLLSFGVRQVGAAIGSIVGALGPVLTLIMAVLFLDEKVGLWHIAGFVLVISGVLLLGKFKAPMT